MTTTAPGPDDGQLELPGIRPPVEQDTPMVAAARMTLLALRKDGKLEPRHAVQSQLVLSLSAAIDGGARAGRASAVAMAAAQLRETMLVLDPVPDAADAGNGRQALDEFMAKLEAAANGGQS